MIVAACEPAPMAPVMVNCIGPLGVGTPRVSVTVVALDERPPAGPTRPFPAHPYHGPVSPAGRRRLLMRHVLSALVQNQPGVLAHISGMLASRGSTESSIAGARDATS